MHDDVRKLTLVLGVALSVVAILVVASFSFVAVEQPGCASCHDDARFVSGTSTSPHAKVACIRCHGAAGLGDRVAFAEQQYFGMYLRIIKVDPAVAHVNATVCSQCHPRLLKQVSVAGGLRIRHAQCAVGRDCADCHSASAHGRATSWPKGATMDMCFSCHGGEGVTARCNACHEAKLPSDRIKTGTFSVTHGPNYKKTHGLGDMKTCVACHTASKCARCHGPGVPHSASYVREHSTYAVQADAKCTMCHRATFCLDCHGLTMPHPKSFASSHRSVVKRQGDTLCKRCHNQIDCDSCHEKHVHPTTKLELNALGRSTVETVAP